MLFKLLFVASAAGFSLTAPPTSKSAIATRREVCQAAGALGLLAPLSPAVAAEPKEAATLRATSKALKELLDGKEAFVAAYAAGDGELPALPAPIPFTTFQKLEKTSDPEFMEAAIDYAEAFRGAKDLVKLAKLTKQKVVVSSKEPGKPRVDTEMSYGDAPGSGLASGKEYAERALQEVLGASLALDAAISYMK